MALPPGGRSSLYHDLMAGHRMELEALHGTLARLADKHGIPAPAARAVYAILSPWAARYGS
jgi:2-dehydropantoate 2-reductase